MDEAIAPDWLEGEALEEFNRLYKMRSYREDEIDRLAEYAHTIATVKRMRIKLDSEGEVLVSPRTGGAYTNPTYNQMIGMQSRMDKLRDKLFPPNEKPQKKKVNLREELLDG